VILQTTIADVMLVGGDPPMSSSSFSFVAMMQVYRCWIVYGRSWLVIALPLLLVLGNAAVAGVVMYLEITLHAHALLNIRQLKPFGAAFWAMTIVINVLTTSVCSFPPRASC
jgi:hypothetical protein